MSPKIHILGNEDKATPYIQWAKGQWENHDGGAWYKHTGDCLIQFNKDGEDGYIRFIDLYTPRLAFTPRSGDLQDTAFHYGDMLEKDLVDYTPAINGTGWLPQDNSFGYIPYLRDDVFPYSNMNGTGDSYRTGVTFSKEDNQFVFLGEESLFGNLVWVSDDGLYACSWYGTPTRMFRDEYKKYYETFTKNIFVAGEKIDGPAYALDDYVLGASYPDGILYVVGYHRLSPAKVVVSRLGAEWIQLGEVEHGYDGLPWFADSTGLVFTHPDGSIIEISEDEIIYTAREADSGIASETVSGLPTWSSSFLGEYLFEGSRKAALEFIQSIVSSSSAISDTSTGTFVLEHKAVLSTDIGIIGPYNIAVGSVYYAQYGGTKCSYSWTASAGFDVSEDTGIITITDTSSCGMGSVSVTVVGGANDGVSATKTVKLPNGVWVEELYIGAIEVCYDYGMPQWWTRTSGDLRYTYRVYWSVTNTPDSDRCDTEYKGTLDNGIETGVWISCSGNYGGLCGGCGVGVRGSYICYSASLMRIERWVCP